MRDGVMTLNRRAACRIKLNRDVLADCRRFAAFDEMKPRVAGLLGVRDAPAIAAAARSGSRNGAGMSSTKAGSGALRVRIGSSALRRESWLGPLAAPVRPPSASRAQSCIEPFS